MKHLNQVMQNTFFQLFAVYSFLILASSLNILSKYTLHFELFSIILGIFSLFVLYRSSLDDKQISNKTHNILLYSGLALIFLTRSLPYLNNSIPLGYDAGLYKYGIEHGLSNMDNWIVQGGMEPGFLYIMKLFSIFLPTNFILIWLFILFNVLLGYAIYLTTYEYFNKKAALFSLFIYAFSIAQFMTFEFMYYKNILGLILILFSLYFFKRQRLFLFVIFAGLSGSIHRPTFYLFCLSFFIYAFLSPIKTKGYDYFLRNKNLFLGTSMIIIAASFYLGQFSPAIKIMFEPVFSAFFQPGESPGTFISLFSYQFYSLAYLPLALIGFFFIIRKKHFSLIFFLTLVSAIIVYFQFFFFNRFIIHLDIFLIILSGLGFSLLTTKNKKAGLILAAILFLSLIISSLSYSLSSSPLIDNTELSLIKELNLVEQDAYILCTSSFYSPWIQGYSNRKVIAPGLFDYNRWDESQWNNFWLSDSESAVSMLKNSYPNINNLYIFIGKHSLGNNDKFKHNCFQLYKELNSAKIYKLVC